MPTTPAADPTQKALLTNLTTLAQTDAVTTGNQISMLNTQITNYQQGVTLFQTRYDYWDRFITDYANERRYLDGNYQATPLVVSDFTGFASQTGRLWNASAAEPGRFSPQRIAEFDGGDLTYDLNSDELIALAREATARDYLENGFSTPGLASGLTTEVTLSPGATTLVVSSTSAATIPVGNPILVIGSATAAIVWIDAAVLSQTGGSVTDPETEITTVTPYLYTLTVELRGQTFSSIPSGGTLVGTCAGFINSERTTKTSNNPVFQSVLNGLVSLYSGYVTAWKILLNSQHTSITNTVNEDQPDVTYVSNQLAALTQLNSYLNSTDVSDSGLAAIQTLNTARVSARTARLAYIANRMTQPLPDVSPYDQRYNYADRLYNTTDGAITTVNVLTTQRDSLSGQQVISNQRAATYASESF